MQLFRKRRKIDFIIGGSQKSGTTALDFYLRQHPEIGMASRKELHFFDNEKVFSNIRIKFSKYEEKFDLKLNKKAYGEATPIYLYWKPSCKRIWKYNPKIKMIFILRNPIERALSHWNMEYDREFEQESFATAIRNETERINTAHPLQHRIYSYIDRGMYSEQIARYKNYFPDNQLMFIKYEDFNNHQEKTLNQIFNFLNVNPEEFTFNRKTVHKRKKHSNMSSADKDYLLNIFKNDIQLVEKMLNWDCSDWLE